MKLRNRFTVSGIAVTAATLSLSVAQPAQAGAGEWDNLGRHDVYYDSQYRTKAVKSSGGAFKACIFTSSSESSFYELQESDKGHDDKLVAEVRNGGCYTFRNIDAYVDGDNNRAEFFIGTEDDPEMLSVQYYD
ncbi:hypothetical protein ACFYWX_28680 [Streptomyces sp. NPDC002888]|uniref:hypothetical protein n=1 Tax=Streptomyces sp. NPDC002888 TaxID=3364668 RepID=UPI0036C1F5E8